MYILFGFVIHSSQAGQDPSQVYRLHIDISTVRGEQVSDDG